MDNTLLTNELLSAVKQCTSLKEEEGGVLLTKDGTIRFVKITNNLSGEPIAQGLWEADRQEYYDKVLAEIKNGWQVYASFHTHPIFLPIPSALDLTELFKGFSRNFIYSNKYNKITEWLVTLDTNNVVTRVALANTYLADSNEIKQINHDSN